MHTHTHWMQATKICSTCKKNVIGNFRKKKTHPQTINRIMFNLNIIIINIYIHTICTIKWLLVWMCTFFVCDLLNKSKLVKQYSQGLVFFLRAFALCLINSKIIFDKISVNVIHGHLWEYRRIKQTYLYTLYISFYRLLHRKPSRKQKKNRLFA